MDQQQPEKINAVFHDEKAADLGDGLGPADEQDKSGEDRGQGARDQQRPACSGSNGSTRASATAPIVPPPPAAATAQSR